MELPPAPARSRVAAGGVLAAQLLAAASSHGQLPPPPGVELDWQAPPTCPSGSNVLQRAEQLLRHSAAPKEPVRARAIVVDAGEAYSVTLETQQGTQTWHRTLRAPSCEELADAAALVVAMAVDPDLGGAKAGDPPPQARSAADDDQDRLVAPIVAPLPAALPPTPAPPTASPPGEASPLFSVHAAARALGDVGALPRPALGVEIAAGAGVSALRVELTGTLLPGVREVTATAPDRGGEIGLWAIGPRLCYELVLGSVRALGCAGLEGGQITGDGFGATSWTDTRSATWLAARIGGRVVIELWPAASASLALEGVAPVTRPEFVLENLGRVHRPSALNARLGLGVELHF